MNTKHFNNDRDADDEHNDDDNKYDNDLDEFSRFFWEDHLFILVQSVTKATT